MVKQAHTHSGQSPGELSYVSIHSQPAAGGRVGLTRARDCSANQINPRHHKDISTEQHHHGTLLFFPRLPARYNKNKYEMASYSKHELMLGLGLISKKQLNRL